MPRVVRDSRLARSCRLISSASGPCEPANAMSACSRIAVPVDPAQPPRVAIPDHRPRLIHVENKANVVRSSGLSQPKASRHSRLNDDNSPMSGQGQNDPLTSPTHLADRRPPAESRQVVRRTASHERGIEDLELPQPATLRAQAAAHGPSFRLRVTRASSNSLPSTARSYRTSPRTRHLIARNPSLSFKFHHFY